MEKPKRNWAKGARLAFLNSRLDGFRAARLQSLTKAGDFTDQVVNDYFATFDWRLPLTEDPPDQGDQGDRTSAGDPIEPESLTQEEEARKKAIVSQMKTTISAWLNYRTKKNDGAGKRVNAKNDPYVLLLAQLIGVGSKPPRLLLPYQHWSKTHYDTHVKPEFEARFPKSGTKDKQRTAQRAQLTQELFDRLPEEEKEHYAREAKETHKEALAKWKEKLNGKPSEDPRDRQRAIDRLGQFAGPILEGLSNLLGMHISLFAGGPEPAKRGQINVLSIHHGVNKEVVPKTWQASDKTKFKMITSLFQEYLATCYSVAERNAASLPELDLSASSSSIVQNDIPTRTTNSLDSNESIDTSRKRTRRSNGKQKAKKRRTRSRSRSPSGSPTPSSTPESGHNSHSESSDSEGHSASDTPSRTYRDLPFSVKKVDYAARLMGTSSGSGKRSKKSTFKRPDPATTVIAPSVGAERASPPDQQQTPTLSGTASVGAGRTSPPADPRASSSGASIGAEQAPTPDPSNTTSVGAERAPPRDLSVPPRLDNGSMPTVPMTDWPSWLQVEYRLFRSAKLGDVWETLLLRFVDFEARSGFCANKGASNSMSTHLRPKEIHWWIQQGRDLRNERERIPAIDDIDGFAARWWSWWRHLQPATGGDWTTLDKPGLNGMLSVIACLYWWGQLAKGDLSKETAWEIACKEVGQVFDVLLSGPSRSS